MKCCTFSGHAIDLNAAYAPAHNGCGNSLYYLKRYDEALVAYFRAIELDFLNAEYYHCRGGAFLKMGRYEEALRDLNRSIELDNTKAYSYSRRADIYRALGRLEEMVRDYTSEIALEPQNASAYSNRATGHVELNNYRDAFTDFDLAIELDPYYALAYNNRGGAYANQKQYDKYSRWTYKSDAEPPRKNRLPFNCTTRHNNSSCNQLEVSCLTSSCCDDRHFVALCLHFAYDVIFPVNDFQISFCNDRVNTSPMHNTIRLMTRGPWQH